MLLKQVEGAEKHFNQVATWATRCAAVWMKGRPCRGIASFGGSSCCCNVPKAWTSFGGVTCLLEFPLAFAHSSSQSEGVVAFVFLLIGLALGYAAGAGGHASSCTASHFRVREGLREAKVEATSCGSNPGPWGKYGHLLKGFLGFIGFTHF